MSDFASMLMMDAIDLSWNHHAEEKAMQSDTQNSLEQPKKNYRHHTTVPERRKSKALAKKYEMPKCGIRYAMLREMASKDPHFWYNFSAYSEKESKQVLHNIRSYNAWSKREAMRIRHPKAFLEACLEDFELEMLDNESLKEPDFFESEAVYLFGIDSDPEYLSSYYSLTKFEDMWNCGMFSSFSTEDIQQLDELIDDGDVFLFPSGGIYLASPEAVKFACEHEELFLSLIS